MDSSPSSQSQSQKSFSAFRRLKRMLSPKRKDHQIDDRVVNELDRELSSSSNTSSCADSTDLQTVFNHFDEDKDGKLSEVEEKKTELKQAFGIYDMEGNGVITADGLKRMLSRLGESRTINDCKAMIRAFDLNNDGVLSFDEFLIMMR